MKIIKLGGTSMQSPSLLSNVIDIIKKYNEKIVVVVSAIGRKGFSYSTDTLIDSLKENYISKKEYDRFISLGELYASIILSNQLNKNDILSYALSFHEIGIKCDNNYSNGNIISLNNRYIKDFSSKYQVLVVPGFIGESSENQVITLGRGSSDLTAVIMACMLNEKEVTLFKDVDGVFPTILYPLSKIKPYKNLSYDEVLALVDIDYKVINKKALILAKDNKIKIQVKNFNINDYQTLVSSVPSNGKIIGFNIINNVYFIATFSPKIVSGELDEIFKLNHIFVKNFEYKENYFSFLVVSSQLLLVRKIIISKYFKDMLIWNFFNIFIYINRFICYICL